MDVWQEINPREVGETVALSVTLVAAGAFVGIEYTAKTVLLHTEPLEATPWLESVEGGRQLAFVVAMLGFAVILALDFFDS